MKKKPHFIARLIGNAAIVWLIVYGVFRIWTVWYSFSLVAGIVDRMIIILFILAELFILMQGLGYISNSLRALRKYQREEIFYTQEDFPYVEVVIPAFEEPAEVLYKTVIAAKCLDYPNFKIKILDDSEDKEAIRKTKQVAKDLDIGYVLQPYPRHGAKAGNLNDYLKITKAKYLAVFDADYRPTRDFLKLVVPQLEQDEKLAYVQTPQFYSNVEDSVVSKAAQTVQSIFFEYICEGKSIQNAMFLCGTNFVIRTDALRKVGGFSEDSITEDFSTSMKLCQHNYKTRYYNFVVAFGDGPITFEEYFKQQYRWARGTIEVFLKNLKLLVTAGHSMTWGQKIEFFLSGNYYFIGLAWLTMILVPPLFLLFNIPVYFANPLFYTGAYLPYFIFSLLFYIQTLSTRHYPAKNILMSQSLTILTLPIYAKAAINALLRRKSVFAVTDKSVLKEKPVIPWKLMRLQLFLIYVNIFSIWIGMVRYGITENKVALVINIIWAIFHIMIFGYLPLLVILERKKWLKTK